MIEKYFRAGVRLRWAKPRDVIVARDGTIVDSTLNPTPMAYDGLDGNLVDPYFRMLAPSTLGLTMRMPIRYVWLDYSHGRTARIHIGPYDVLTGFMSGCIIVHWTERGINFAGHIGTVTGLADVNRNVKRTFSFAMNKSAKGFNPAGAWLPGEISTLSHQLKPPRAASIAALVTTQGLFYSLVLFQMNWDKTEWCVGGIKQVAPMLHDELKLRLLRND